MKDNPIVPLLIALVMILIAFGLLFIQPYMESQTYNKLTGAHTTMWDAMWVELRVQDKPTQP